MKLKGSHTIKADTLRSLYEQLDNLPDSVLDSADVTDAVVDFVEERTFHPDYSVTAWYLTLDLEWPVEA